MYHGSTFVVIQYHMCMWFYIIVFECIHSCYECYILHRPLYFSQKRNQLNYTQTRRRKHCQVFTVFKRYLGASYFHNIYGIFFVIGRNFHPHHPPHVKKKSTKKKICISDNSFVAGRRIIFWHDTIFFNFFLQERRETMRESTLSFSQLWPLEGNGLESLKMTWHSSWTMKLLSRAQDNPSIWSACRRKSHFLWTPALLRLPKWYCYTVSSFCCHECRFWRSFGSNQNLT